MCIRPKGRTQCIFPRSQHSCLYVYIYILTKSEFISSCSRPAVCSNIVQITQIYFFCKCFFFKWPPVAILDVQKSLCIAFLTISDQYHNFCLCEIFLFLQNGCQRPITGHFRSIRNFLFKFLHFRSHFWPFQIDTQLVWSHFWPFQINTQLFFYFVLQNGCRRPFWMSEIYFGSHIWPF